MERDCRFCGVRCDPPRNAGGRCPDCLRKYKREWAAKRRAQGLPSGGKASPEWWKRYSAEYFSDPEVKKRAAENQRRYRKDPRLQARHEARLLVRNAVRRGELIKQPCANCGSEKKVQAHHPDYSKPLEVIWLCGPCHRAEHSKAEHGQ